MRNNPSLFEINTRVWLKRFGSKGRPALLSDVPESYWNELKKKGIDFVWLMGVWKIAESAVKKYCFEDGLVKEYKEVLPDYEESDVVGSPYAVDVYEVNPSIGDKESLARLKNLLNKKRMKLILDFIPNHFSAESRLIKENPDIFLSAGLRDIDLEPATFFHNFDQKKIFAHGKDPFFAAWQDTIQVDYFNNTPRKFMTETLLEISQMCDGVRCDMAMLILNHVFKNTWGGLLLSKGIKEPETEFWDTAINEIKRVKSDFIFIAETYWDLEWELQQKGFDFTYDKKLMDRLKSGSVEEIHDHLLADPEYQKKSVRFIENHDEDRSLKVMGNEKAKAAAIIMSTIPGMHFYYDGQFDGKKIKLPLQLGREPEEHPDAELHYFYDRLFEIINLPVFNGEWFLLKSTPAWEEEISYRNILAWSWKKNEDNILIIINYSESKSSCRVKVPLNINRDEIVLNDLLSDKEYRRSVSEVNDPGLYIELDRYSAHIFLYKADK